MDICRFLRITRTAFIIKFHELLPMPDIRSGFVIAVVGYWPCSLPLPRGLLRKLLDVYLAWLILRSKRTPTRKKIGCEGFIVILSRVCHGGCDMEHGMPV